MVGPGNEVVEVSRKLYGLLPKNGIKMAGYWPSSSLRVFEPSEVKAIK